MADERGTRTDEASQLDEVERMSSAFSALKASEGARLVVYYHPPDGSPRQYVRAFHDLSIVEDPLEYIHARLADEGIWPSGTYEVLLTAPGPRGGMLRKQSARVGYRFSGSPLATSPHATQASTGTSATTSVDQVVQAISSLWRLSREMNGGGGGGTEGHSAMTLQALAAAVKDLRATSDPAEAGKAAAQVGQALVGAMGSMLGPVLSALAQSSAHRAGDVTQLRDLVGALRELREMDAGHEASAESNVPARSGMISQVREVLELVKELRETVAPEPRHGGGGVGALIVQGLIQQPHVWQAVTRIADAIRVVALARAGGLPTVPEPRPHDRAPQAPQQPATQEQAASPLPDGRPVLGSLDSYLASAIRVQDPAWYPIFLRHLEGLPPSKMLVAQVRSGLVRPEALVEALRQVGLPELGLPGAAEYLAGWARWLASGGVGADSGTEPGGGQQHQQQQETESAEVSERVCSACGARYTFSESEWAEYLLETRGEARCTALTTDAGEDGRPKLCWGPLQ